MPEIASSYLLCCVQRTGSWLLTHTLRDLGVAGAPSDYFDEVERRSHSIEWRVETFRDYLDAVMRNATTPNGVFGSKMMWNDFARFRYELRAADPTGGTDAALLEHTLPNLRYIWLRREDKVRQGISWWRAVVTTSGHSRQTWRPSATTSLSPTLCRLSGVRPAARAP